MDDVLRLNAGDLRDRIEFYTTSAVKDDGGGFPTSTKTLAFSMLAKVLPKGSLKTYEGENTEYIETWRVRIRYENGRVPFEQMLVKFRDDWFSILGIQNLKARNLVLELIIARK